MTIINRIKLFLTRKYQCRCGAILEIKHREQHEYFHKEISKFFTLSNDDIEMMRTMRKS